MRRPKTQGVYVLVIFIEEPRMIKVGSLGNLMFENGIYAYVGSAQNSLEKRVLRHLNRGKKIFWHIDYLLNNEHVKIINVLYKIAPKCEECRIAEIMSGVYRPVQGFGSSDCNCKSHLFNINGYESFKMLMKKNNFTEFPIIGGKVNHY
ncbi:MAG: GIY-YIG nuclease family protein [Candidatus Bathyarchaeia archaeon]